MVLMAPARLHEANQFAFPGHTCTFSIHQLSRLTGEGSEIQEQWCLYLTSLNGEWKARESCKSPSLAWQEELQAVERE